MDSDKSKKPEEEEKKKDEEGQEAPSDALSRTPEELEEEEKQSGDSEPEEEPEKKVSPIKKFFRKVNVYFLIFILVVVVAGAITVVNYLNSQKDPVLPTVGSQELSEETLQQLSNTDASVGNTSQTLTIQGNAVIAGQTLMRGNLNVAGNIQAGGSLRAPTVTISGQSNLGATQINSLQVAQNTALQGSTTLRDLSVSGASTFSGGMTASQITVTRLIMSGNAVLQVPNHVSFTGPTPGIASNSTGLGNGGSASLSGSDTAGVININTGNNTAPGCFARVTFQQAFPSQPRVIVGPVGAAAGQTQYYVDRNTSGFSICTAIAAPANQSFAFDYFVTF